MTAIVISGTDTDIGKTLITGMLMRLFKTQDCLASHKNGVSAVTYLKQTLPSMTVSVKHPIQAPS